MYSKLYCKRTISSPASQPCLKSCTGLKARVIADSQGFDTEISLKNGASYLLTSIEVESCDLVQDIYNRTDDCFVYAVTLIFSLVKEDYLTLLVNEPAGQYR